MKKKYGGKGIAKNKTKRHAFKQSNERLTYRFQTTIITKSNLTHFSWKHQKKKKLTPRKKEEKQMSGSPGSKVLQSRMNRYSALGYSPTMRI